MSTCAAKGNNNNNNNNNLILYYLFTESKGKSQLQTQHSLDAGNYIMYRPKLQASTGGRK
jgi:hypothetical protein